MIRRRFAGLAVVAAAMLLIFPLTSAEAAEHDLEFTNATGAINLEGFDPLVIDAGQAGLVGTWDDQTGDFTGVTTINPFSIGPPAVPVDIVLRLDPAGAGDNVTGEIDPATGEALLNWQNSIFYHMLCDRTAERRIRLSSDEGTTYNILDKLKDEGHTDCVSMIHHFTDQGRVGEMDARLFAAGERFVVGLEVVAKERESEAAATLEGAMARAAVAAEATQERRNMPLEAGRFAAGFEIAGLGGKG